MPSCTDVIRMLTKSSVTLATDDNTHNLANDQIMSIDQRTEFFQFDELQNEDNGIVNRAWTSEIPQLEKLDHSYPNRVWNWAEVAAVFKSLVLSGCNISYLDKEMSLFSNVTRLDVSSNKLTHIGELPPGLVGLFLNCNPLSPMAFNNISVPFLRYLDMSYCEMSAVPTLDPDSFPSLCAIDLSGNDISDIELLDKLRSLPMLSHVCVMNNPLVLRPNYRQQVLELLPKLTHLDEIQVTPVNKTKVDVSSDKDLNENQAMIRISITSLRKLPDPGPIPDVDLFGQIQVKFDREVAMTPLLPWGKSLVMEEGDEPDVVVVVEESKPDKKKGKGKVEEVVPAVPSVDRTIPQTLDLNFEVSTMLRDAILFDDVRVSILRSQKVKEAGEAAESPPTQQVEDIEIVGEASVNLKQLLNQVKKGMKETVTIDCEGCEEGESAVMKLQLQLNP